MTDLLLHGDAFEEMAKLPDSEVDMVLVDLPYGTTENKWDAVLPFDKLWAAWRRVAKPGAPMVLFTQQPFTTMAAASNLKNLRTEWIWQKSRTTGFLNAKKYPLKAHENVLIFCDRMPPYHPRMRPGKPYTTKGGHFRSENYGKDEFRPGVVNTGTRYPQTVLAVRSEAGGKHPTQKPLALNEYLIETYTQPGQVVLDCCMGSGTAGVAALRTGRRFIGIERDPQYFAIAQERIGAALKVDLAASEEDESERDFILLDCVTYDLFAKPLRIAPVARS